MKRVRIATRASDLALWQARYVAERIGSALACETEILPLKTTGDRLAGSLAKVGGKGLFVKEIEDALLGDRADVAVHSAKDLPAKSPEGLVFVAFPERADPRDALVATDSEVSLASLRSGARVGTGSVRRTAQLLRARPDLEVVGLRGNVPTRLRALEEGLDAIVLACAGLDRLGRTEAIVERIAPETLLPAVAQGTLALQTRCGDALEGALQALNHSETEDRVVAERAFQAALGADCHVPVAGFAELAGASLRLRGLVIAPDGRACVAGESTVARSEAASAGSELAERLLSQGAEDLLAQSRELLA